MQDRRQERESRAVKGIVKKRIRKFEAKSIG